MKTASALVLVALLYTALAPAAGSLPPTQPPDQSGEEPTTPRPSALDNYILAAKSLKKGGGLRFSNAFQANTVIDDIRMEEAEKCAEACDAIDTCRAFLHWLSSDEYRCRLLATAAIDDLSLSRTESVSYIKSDLVQFQIVHQGMKGTEKGTRFVNAFESSNILFRAQNGPTRAQCMEQCLSYTTCMGIHYYFSKHNNKWFCNGLRSVSYQISPTSVQSLSLSRLRTFEAPAGYTIQAEGRTLTNGGAARRYKNGFDYDDAIISSTIGTTVQACADDCTADPACQAIFWVRIGSQWRCRLLHDISGPFVPTALPNYSMKKLSGS